jgi:hypothetical protein
MKLNCRKVQWSLNSVTKSAFWFLVWDTRDSSYLIAVCQAHIDIAMMQFFKPWACTSCKGMLITLSFTAGLWYCTNSSNEWNVKLECARCRRTSASVTANKEWDSLFALSLCSVENKVLYTADQMIWCSDTLYSRRAITTRANMMTTIIHSIVHSND